MPSWAPKTAGQYTEDVRAALDAAIGVPLVYDRAIDGAWTDVAGQLAFDVAQDTQQAVWSISVDTATGSALDQIATDAGIYRRPASYSRYPTFWVVQSYPRTIPAGTIIRGGGPVGLGQWRVLVDTVVSTEDDPVIVEALEPGPIQMPNGLQVHSLVTPLPDIILVGTNTAAGGYTIGRARETDAELRGSVLAARVGAAAVSPTGIRARVLSLPWIVACSTTTPNPGECQVTIVPPAVGDDRKEALAQIIYRVALGVSSKGNQVWTVTGADGYPHEVRWADGASEAVTVSTEVVLALGVSLADVTSAIEANVRSVFAGLGVGDTLYYSTVYSAIAGLAGVVGVTGIVDLTLNGGTADIVPAISTNILVPGTINITV